MLTAVIPMPKLAATFFGSQYPIPNTPRRRREKQRDREGERDHCPRKIARDADSSEAMSGRRETSLITAGFGIEFHPSPRGRESNSRRARTSARPQHPPDDADLLRARRSRAAFACAPALVPSRCGRARHGDFIRDFIIETIIASIGTPAGVTSRDFHLRAHRFRAERVERNAQVARILHLSPEREFSLSLPRL